MMDIETHTVVFLRDLLATRASFDPEVTAFLSCWVYEELWHGEAFSRFLGEAGFRVAPTFEDVSGDDPFPTRVDRNQWVRQKFGTKGYVSHIGTLLGSALFRDFVAVHMTWGAVNELGTLTGYHRIIAQDREPRPDPAPPGGDQGRAPALRLLPGAGQDAPRAVEAGADDHPVGARASLGAGRHRRPAPGGDRLRDPLTSSATPTGWSPSRRWRASSGSSRGCEGAGSSPTRSEGAAARLGQPLGSGLSPSQSRGRTLRPVRRVHHLETHRLELVAELVRARVVLRRPSRVALGHQPPDLLGGLPRRPRLPFEIEPEHAGPRSRAATASRRTSTSAERSRSFTTRTAAGMSRSFATASRNRESNSFAAGPRSSVGRAPLRDVPTELLHPMVRRLQRLLR